MRRVNARRQLAGPSGPGNKAGNPGCYGMSTRKSTRESVQRGMVADKRGSLAGHQHRARPSAHAPKPRCARERAAVLETGSSVACCESRASAVRIRPASARRGERPARRRPFMDGSQTISDPHCWSRSPGCRSATRSVHDRRRRSAQLARLSATCRSQSAAERSDCSGYCWC